MKIEKKMHNKEIKCGEIFQKGKEFCVYAQPILK